MGTPAAAAVSLERLVAEGHEIAAVYTQPDRPSGRGKKITFSPVKQLALDRGLKLLQPAKIRTAEALTHFVEHDADAAVVVAYGRILPEGFLNAFPMGAINVHFSLLPKYRGAAPVNWAIVNGESLTGVTTIQMDEGLDTGDILIARTAPIFESETAPELMEKLSYLGADVLSETLAHFHSIVPRKQDNDEATLAPIMTRMDGLINWSMTAAEIVDRVRGFQPFPGSFTFLGDTKVAIWKATAGELTGDGEQEPGRIISIGDGRMTVAAGGNSVLEIQELQLEGKRRMLISEVINGGAFRMGGVFKNETVNPQ